MQCLGRKEACMEIFTAWIRALIKVNHERQKAGLIIQTNWKSWRKYFIKSYIAAFLLKPFLLHRTDSPISKINRIAGAVKTNPFFVWTYTELRVRESETEGAVGAAQAPWWQMRWHLLGAKMIPLVTVFTRDQEADVPHTDVSWGQRRRYL